MIFQLYSDGTWSYRIRILESLKSKWGTHVCHWQLGFFFRSKYTVFPRYFGEKILTRGEKIM